MNININDCYSRPPLSVEDDIPVFSEVDFYVENYDRISGDHLKHFEVTGHNPFMREDYWQEVEESTEVLIKKYANGSRLKVLDVGVGLGRLLERFPDFDRFGVDISRGYLKHAKTKGIEVCMSRIEEIPYKEKYFDILVSSDVLEHVFDLNLVLKKIISVVKENGIIVIRVPYKEDLDGYTQADYPYDLVHLRNFDENSLKILFEKIFNIEVLEWNLCGFRGGRLKKGANIRIYANFVGKIMSLVRKVNDGLYQYLSCKLCHPMEINMVIRNTKLNPSRT